MNVNDVSISAAVLRKLPWGKVLRITKTTDMDGNERDAILYGFHDETYRDLRQSYFDLYTGEYLGES